MKHDVEVKQLTRHLWTDFFLSVVNSSISWEVRPTWMKAPTAFTRLKHAFFWHISSLNLLYRPTAMFTIWNALSNHYLRSYFTVAKAIYVWIWWPLAYTWTFGMLYSYRPTHIPIQWGLRLTLITYNMLFWHTWTCIWGPVPPTLARTKQFFSSYLGATLKQNQKQINIIFMPYLGPLEF